MIPLELEMGWPKWNGPRSDIATKDAHAPEGIGAGKVVIGEFSRGGPVVAQKEVDYDGIGP